MELQWSMLAQYKVSIESNPVLHDVLPHKN